MCVCFLTEIDNTVPGTYIVYNFKYTYDSAKGPNNRQPIRMPAINTACATSSRLVWSQTRSNFRKMTPKLLIKENFIKMM